MSISSVAVESVWCDVRYALGTFRRSPGVAVTAGLTLALAIGANTAIFSLLNALVLRELPVKNPHTLVAVSATTNVQGALPLTFPLFRELSSRQQVFSAVIGTSGNGVVNVGGGRSVVKGLLWAATGNVHEELGIRPVAGRLLAARDMTIDPPHAEPVAVMGYGFWQRHYRGDVSVIGRSLRVDGVPFTVVGIAPAGFTGFALTNEPDITIPLAALQLLGRKTPLATSGIRNIQMVGRLRDGVSLEQAHAQLAVVWADALEAATPATFDTARRTDFQSMVLTVTSAATGNAAPLRLRYTRPLLVLLAIAGLVLLIACTNVAGVLLARASARRREIVTRLALGASRRRVAQQLVIEGLLLSAVGAAGGLLLSYWACSLIVRVVFADSTIPTVLDGSPDTLVIALTIAVAIVAGIICSAVPAWRTVRDNSVDVLRVEGRTTSASGRTGRLIIATQVALSVVLLTAAGVLVRSLAELRALDTGIERSGNVVVIYSEAAQPGGYIDADNDTYYPRVLSRLEALPGVQRASISLLKPGTGGGIPETVTRWGDLTATAGLAVTHSPVSPGFFDAVGVRLVRGRGFDWRDNSRSRGVAILSETLARRLFSNADPIGERVRVGLEPSRDGLEVIGIVADARLYNLRSPDTLAVYTPALQDRNASFKCFVVRGDHLTSAALISTIEGLGHERISNTETLQYITDRSLLLERLTAMMAGFFGSLVVLLAGVGLFGLMSQTVTARRKEIGIRIAVGASHRRVVWKVIGDGLAVTLIGVTVGLVAALSTVHVVEALVFGVSPQDPLTLGTAAASLIVTAIVACTIPALRASRVDPLIALRE